MEQKKSERAGRGAKAWQPQARQQELDEEDRFQVRRLSCLPLAGSAKQDKVNPSTDKQTRQTSGFQDLTLMTCKCLVALLCDTVSCAWCVCLTVLHSKIH